MFLVAPLGTPNFELPPKRGHQWYVIKKLQLVTFGNLLQVETFWIWGVRNKQNLWCFSTVLISTTRQHVMLSRRWRHCPLCWLLVWLLLSSSFTPHTGVAAIPRRGESVRFSPSGAWRICSFESLYAGRGTTSGTEPTAKEKRRTNIQNQLRLKRV